MSILGIGPLEIIVLAVFVLLLFRPEDLASTGKTIGRFLNSAKKSDTWKSILDLRQGAKKVGQEFISDSGIEEIRREFEVPPDLDEIRSELNQFGFKPNNMQSKPQISDADKDTPDSKTITDAGKSKEN